MRLVILAVAFLVLLYMAWRDEKRTAMYNARLYLERAHAEYERTGNVPASESDAQLRVFTDSVVVAGVSYRCALALDWPALGGEGFLAISTNRTVLWIDKVRAPRIIDDHYHAPLFRHGV